MVLTDVKLRLFVSKWFQVLFHRGQPPTFHLSLTVLVHYRWYWLFSLTGQFRWIPARLSCPTVLKKSNKERKFILEYGTITLYGSPFQGDSFNNLPKCSPSANTSLSNKLLNEVLPTLNPCNTNHKDWFRLFPFRSPLLREWENP